jgi:hypothetical protein
MLEKSHSFVQKEIENDYPLETTIQKQAKQIRLPSDFS